MPEPGQSQFELLKKINEAKDVLVIGGIGFFGFLVGEVSTDIVWIIIWIFVCFFDSTCATKKCNGYSPGHLMKSWWDATKKAWNDLWN